MMWWSYRMVASPPSLKNTKAVAPTAKNAGAGRGVRMPRANTYAPIGSMTGPSAVMSLNAMLYGSTTSSRTMSSAGNGK